MMHCVCVVQSVWSMVPKDLSHLTDDTNLAADADGIMLTDSK